MSSRRPERARGLAVVGALVLGAGGAARADVGAEVAVGGGVHAGDGMGAFDARADWTRDAGGAAIGLGVRLRAIGDGLYRGDWDSASDWAAIVRYVELHTDDGALAIAAGAQSLETLGDGALVDGVIAAAVFDRRATGAHARARLGAATVEALVDDVTAPTVLGARVAWPRLAVDVAADPLARFGAATASSALSTTYREVTDRIELGARAETSRAAGTWLGASTSADLGRARFTLGGEVTAGTSHDVAAPFGPLYELERTGPFASAAAAGLGGAVRLDVDALAVHLGAEMRARPGLGGEYVVRVSAPAYDRAQLAAIIAGNPSHDLLVAGGAIRVRVDRRVFVSVEAARQVVLGTASGGASGVAMDPSGGMDASAGAMRAAWQATAWLGFASTP